MNSSQKSGNDVIFLVLKPIAQQHYICKEKLVLGNVISSLIRSHSGYIRTSTYFLGSLVTSKVFMFTRCVFITS